MTALIALDADQLAALDSLATAKKQTREAASHADRTAAYAALKEFDRNPKDVRAAAAAKAKADADVAKAQAAVAVARAAHADAHAVWYAAVDQQTRELHRLRLAALDRPRFDAVADSLHQTIETFRAAQDHWPIAHVGKKLTTARTFLNACLDGAEDPPEHIEQWFAELLAEFEASKREAHATQRENARTAEKDNRTRRIFA